MRVLVWPATATDALRERLRGIPDITVLSVDAPHLRQVLRADVCLVYESSDAAELVRDLTQRLGLVVIAVGDHPPSSLHALRYLSEGADDYLSTRSTAAEWVARVRAATRRRAPARSGRDETELEAGDLTISLGQHQVWRGGSPVRLTRTEFSLLEILGRHLDTPVPYASLTAGVWGVEHVGTRHYLRVYIRRLREKLEADPAHPRLITTETHASYMLRSARAPGGPALGSADRSP